MSEDLKLKTREAKAQVADAGQSLTLLSRLVREKQVELKARIDFVGGRSRMIGMQFSFFFEFFDLEKFPRTEWMILYQKPDEYGTSVEEAQPRKIQQCQCCGEAILGKTWALKTGAKHYYRYYNYLCERCYGNTPKIIAIWEEMGRPSHNHFSQEIMDRFKRFKTRLGEEGLVEFATRGGLLRLQRSV